MTGYAKMLFFLCFILFWFYLFFLYVALPIYTVNMNYVITVILLQFFCIYTVMLFSEHGNFFVLNLIQLILDENLQRGMEIFP